MTGERYPNPYQGERRGTTRAIPEDDLAGLFERRRPDASSFRDRIRQRVEEREAAGESPLDAVQSVRAGAENVEPSERREASPWRRAAALMPVPTSASKLIPAALMWPLFLLAACFGGFFLGRRAISKSMTEAQSSGVRSGRRASSAEKHRFGIVAGAVQFGILGAFVVGGAWIVDAFLVVVLLGMLGFVWVAGRMARAGYASRRQVAEQATAVLMALLIGGSIWFGTALGGAELSAANVGWVFFPLSVSVIALHLMTGQRGAALFMFAWAIWIVVALNPMGFTRSAPAEIREQLVDIAAGLETDELSAWSEAAALHAALTATDEPCPDLSRLAAKITVATASPEGVHPAVWMSAASMGLLADGDWERIARHESITLDGIEAGLAREPFDVAMVGINRTSYYHYRLLALLRTRDLSDESLERLARVAVDLWPRDGEHGALESAAACVRLLEAFGLNDLVEEQRDRSLKLLAECWVGDVPAFRFGKAGGFTSNPEKFRTSFDGPTLAGVELMERFGVSEGIHLGLLRGFLRHEARYQGFWGLGEAHVYLKSLERAALLRLERRITMPERSWVERILDLRAVIIVLLVIALSFQAVRMAPTDLLASRGGAQP